MKQAIVWKLHDPQVGQSLWSTKADALQVARYRKALCRIESHEPQAGEVVSTLGAPDYRVRS
jgi:hypothetical protein